MNNILIGFVVGLLVGGSGVFVFMGGVENENVVQESPQEQVYSIPWMKDRQNKAKVLEIYRKCKENPGLYAYTPNCLNVSKVTESEHLIEGFNEIIDSL